MSEGMIEFIFEGLCPFFTKRLPENRLMVGLIGVYEANEIIHAPTLRITEKDFPEPVIYRGSVSRKLLTGDIYLHLISNDGLAANDISADDSVNLLDIEGLYPSRTFQIDPGRCQARLFFNNGVLSQIDSKFVELQDQNHNVLSVEDLFFTYNVRLQVTIPEVSYAVLHFQNDTDGFEFKAGRKYTVEVKSLPQPGNHNHQMNHFQYFYRLIDNPPTQIIVPEPGGPVDGGDTTCMLGAFGDAPF